MKAFYDFKPDSVQAVGNGSSLIRFDIESFQTEDEFPQTMWKCEEVLVWGKVTREKIVEAIISDKWTISEENKVMNNYIGATKDFFTKKENSKFIAEYEDFLNERKSLKTKANNLWNDFNKD